jgi:cytochrome c-type biogenesis protein CcmH
VIAFVVIAAIMVTVTVAWVLVPLLRRDAPAGVGSDASNLAILRSQIADLDTDVANGTLSPAQYEQAKRELEQRALYEVKSAPDGGADGASGVGAWTAAALAASLPIAAMLVYVAVGNFDAFAPAAVRNAAAGPGGEHDVTPQQVEEMATKLAAKLQKEPDNPDGWVMLARTYYAINRHADAARAFDRAVELVPNSAELLADYADALGAAQGGTLAGKPLQLVERALKIDPGYWKALALAGTAAFDRKDFKQAVAYWERAKSTVPPESPVAQSIDSSIAEARELGGLKFDAVPLPSTAKAPAATSPGAPAKTPAGAGTSSNAAAPSGASVAGTVKLAPGLAAKASAEDTVFIFARAAQGPKMPLAILRKKVKDLPVTFTLDDTMAMAPNMALSNFGEVVIGARVSKSGNAVPQSGDLEGLSTVVKIGASGIAVVIEKMVP